MHNIYTIPPQYNGIDFAFEEPVRKFKGITEIFFNMSAILSGSQPITKIVIDFNDDTPLYIKQLSYTNPQNMGEIISHVYHPTDIEYNIVYYPTMFITFANLATLLYQITIKISKESFYSEYKRISVASCQFIDNLENSMFLTLDTAKGDILNLKIK